MAGIWNFSWLLFWLLLTVVVDEANSKLNVPRVLLPLFNSFSLNFTLENTENGCYKWSTSRNDVVQLDIIDEDRGCSRKAVVSAISKGDVRSTAIVFAEDVVTGVILRCDAIIDKIASLNILTTTRELYMDEAPEAFEVRAYDEQGNEFTSLEGVEFHWTFEKVTNATSGQSLDIIRFLTFAESHYEAPPTVKSLDSRGLRGHVVLMEGLKTGSVKVLVKLPYKEYSYIEPAVAQLTVMYNIIILPEKVHLLVGDAIQYQVLQVNHGQAREIKLPSPQYYLAVEDTNVASLDENGVTVSALNFGQTKIFLYDHNIYDTDNSVKPPSALLTVNQPAHVTLTIQPYNNWAVLIGKRYEIIVEVFDREEHRFRIGDSVEVTTLIPTEYFSVHHKTENGTYWYGTPSQVGVVQVQSTLVSVRDTKQHVHPVTPEISAQANLMIYNPITVYPAEVVLPWDPISKPMYKVTLKASGGDGSFAWHSSNTSTVIVTQSGSVQTVDSGCVEITVAMSSNRNNLAVSNFYVLPPLKLEIVEYMLETELSQRIFLHVALFTKKTCSNSAYTEEKLDFIPFTQCVDMPFVITIWDEKFIHNTSLNTLAVGISCTSFGIEAVGVGTSKVTVSYTHEGGVLEDSVSVASYRPLQPLHPPSGETVLAVGSSRHIAFAGGPRPWLSRPSEHIRTIDMGEHSVVEVNEVTQDPSKDIFVYEVLCRQLGEAEITLTVTNKPVMKHCKRSISTATIRVLCAKPYYITFDPENNVPNGTCPMNFSPERIVAHNYKDAEVDMVVKDEYGRKFDNFSSLQIDWLVSDESLATVLNPDSVFLESTEEYSIVIPVRHYQMFSPSAISGIVEVTAAVVGYQTDMLKQLGIVPEYPPFAILDEKGHEVTPEIKTRMSIIFVSDISISPDQATLFNHPNNKLILQAQEGSGYFDIMLSSEDIAHVAYKYGTQLIEVIPKSEGLVKVALIDLCLPSRPAMADIQVVGIGQMVIDAPERIEKGRCISAVLHLYDGMGNPLPVPEPVFLDLRPILEKDIIGIKMLYDKSPSEPASLAGKIHFIITGLELGEKYLVFSSGEESKTLRSSPVPIQVFPPLKLLPRNLTLVVGSVFQITCWGGPQPDSVIEYMTEENIITITPRGLIEALSIGVGIVSAQAVGYNKISGKKVVYCRDAITIRVIPLVGFKISAPLTRILNGAIMPLWANGIPEQLSPLILGSTEPSPVFTWSLSSYEFGVLSDIYYDTKISLSNIDLISMRFTALKPGRVTVYLNVSVSSYLTGSTSQTSFHSSLDVEIFEELHLIEPNRAGELQSPYILMTPDSVVQLKTNHEGLLTYSLMETADQSDEASGTTAYDDNDIGLPKTPDVITVDQEGFVKSSNIHGRAVIVVTVKEDFGFKQVMSITVEVKPINYLMINLRSEFRVKDNENVESFPKGIQSEFFVTHHDNTGSVFTAARSEVKLRINRYDLLNLRRGPDKTSVIAQLLHTGKTTMKIWDDLVPAHVADYIIIRVGVAILPQLETITLGDILCFSIPLVSNDDRMGYWSTNDDSIMHINPELGVGRSRFPGIVTVFHHLSSTAVPNIEFRVLPVHRVKILHPKESILTNSNPDDIFRVPLVLRSEIDRNKVTSMRSWNGTCPVNFVVSAFPFTCILQFTNTDAGYDVDDVFAVHQDFSYITGEYYCDIVASGNPTPSLSTLETNVSLTVKSGEIVSQPLIMTFLPAVYVSTPEIHLTEVQMAGTLIVNGIDVVLKKVQVIPGDIYITIGPPDTKSVRNSYSYRVELSGDYWESGELDNRLNVTILSKLTKQELQIPIKIHMGGEKYASSPCLVSQVTNWGTYVTQMLYAYRHTIIVLITLIVVIVATVYGFSSYSSRNQSSYRRRSSYFSSFSQGRQSLMMPRQPMMSLRRQPLMGIPRQSGACFPRRSISSLPASMTCPNTCVGRYPFSTCEPVYGDSRFMCELSHRHPCRRPL